MTRQEQIRDIKKEIGNFGNISQIARYIGIGRERAAALMCDYPHIRLGKRDKTYAATDIADAIMKRMWA